MLIHDLPAFAIQGGPNASGLLVDRSDEGPGRVPFIDFGPLQGKSAGTGA